MKNINLVAKSRNLSLDALRILACFFVIVVHITSYGLADPYMQAPNTVFVINDYQIYNIFNSLSRSGVLLFVMISGSFMLDPNIEVSNEKIKKQIIKTIKLLLVFSITYALFFNFLYYVLNGTKISIINIVKDIIFGHTHLWYLYMIIGLYIITPILRIISSNSYSMNEFLIIGLLIAVIIPSLSETQIFSFVSTLLNRFSINIINSYVVVYMLGYKLKEEITNKEISRKTILLLIAIYVISVSFTVAMTSYRKITINDVNLFPYYQNNFVTTVLEAISIFSIFIYLDKIKYFKKIKLIYKLASYTTGIYCIHFGVIQCLLIFFDFNYQAFNKITILFVITVSLSIIATFICKKIPFIKNII